MALASLTRAAAATLLLGALPSCGAVMHSFGDHVIYAEGHAWHTVPGQVGMVVAGNVTALVLSPMLVIGLVTSQSVIDAWVEIGTAAGLAGGLVLGTPSWLVGLPFESSEDDQSPITGSRR